MTDKLKPQIYGSNEGTCHYECPKCQNPIWIDDVFCPRCMSEIDWAKEKDILNRRYEPEE